MGSYCKSFALVLILQTLRFTLTVVFPEGHLIDPSQEPSITHLIELGDLSTQLGQSQAKAAIRGSLSEITVNRGDTAPLQTKLRGQRFTHWNENFEIAEFYGFSKDKLDDLLNKIVEKFRVTGHDVSQKLQSIQWASEWNYKIFEFTFGEVVSSGSVYFGIITLVKQKTSHGHSFNAVTGLYKLDFQVGRIKNVVRRYDRVLGIVVNAWNDVWYDPVSIGYLTQESVKSFCRTKAMNAFYKKGLVTSVKDEL